MDAPQYATRDARPKWFPPAAQPAKMEGHDAREDVDGLADALSSTPSEFVAPPCRESSPSGGSRPPTPPADPSAAVYAIAQWVEAVAMAMAEPAEVYCGWPLVVELVSTMEARGHEIAKCDTEYAQLIYGLTDARRWAWPRRRRPRPR